MKMVKIIGKSDCTEDNESNCEEAEESGDKKETKRYSKASILELLALKQNERAKYHSEKIKIELMKN